MNLKMIVAAVVVAAVWGGEAGAEPMPGPKPRPAGTGGAPPSEAARPASAEVKGAPAPTACQSRLAAMRAVFTPQAQLSGPGGCGGSDIVLLARISTGDRTSIAVEPPATLRCEMALAVV